MSTVTKHADSPLLTGMMGMSNITATASPFSSSAKVFRFSESATRALQYENYECAQPFVQQMAQPVFYSPQYGPAMAASVASPQCFTSPLSAGPYHYAGHQYSFHPQQVSVPINAGLANAITYFPVPPPEHQTIMGPVPIQNPHVQTMLNNSYTSAAPRLDFVASPPIMMMPQPHPKYIAAPAEVMVPASLRPSPVGSISCHNQCVATKPPPSLPRLPPNRRAFATQSNVTVPKRVSRVPSRDFIQGNYSQQPSGKQNSVHQNPKYKTKPCTNYLNNKICPYGDRCQFIHDEKLVVNGLDRAEEQIMSSGSSREDLQQSETSCQVDLSHRLCSSTPVSQKMLRNEAAELLSSEKRSYRQNFGPGVGCKKPSVVDGPHPNGVIQSAIAPNYIESKPK